MEKVFRQRFTGVGVFGAVLAIGSPIVAGVFIGDFVDRPYGGFPRVGVAACGLASMIGWMMVLIGRETYAYIPPQKTEALAALEASTSGEFSAKPSASEKSIARRAGY